MSQVHSSRRKLGEVAADIAGLSLTALRRVIDLVLILLVAWMVFAVMAQVAGRYVFGWSLAWATETATFAQVWMVLLGAGYAMRKRLHVGVDVVVSALPATLRRLVLIPVLGMSLWFLWIVFTGGLILMEVGAFQTSPALQLPMQWIYAILPVAAAYLALETLLAFGAAVLGREGEPLIAASID